MRQTMASEREAKGQIMDKANKYATEDDDIESQVRFLRSNPWNVRTRS